MSRHAKRLYEQFQPEHYDLRLEPRADQMIFSGSVTIRGRKTGRPSQRITLHQKGLKITSAQLTRHDKQGDQPLPISRVNNQNSFDEVRLHTGSLLYPGEYTIQLDFSGKITKDMKGIYPCFFSHEGTEKVIIATQFESHHAREAFPCIDEPEAKATFDLAIVAPKGQTVLSNTPLAAKKAAGQMEAHRFETTPKMSVYLLAFAAGELHASEAVSKSGVQVRSWASVAQPKEALDYATREAADVLDFFADYFGVPYPLKKLDQVALPDFEAGAMENWGMITYREIALLTDPHNRSISSEQYVSLVVSHELSHQWFGNLVTMKWWDDLWLNESFAGLMEHVAPAALHPDWQQWEHYAIGDIPLITSRDSYKDIQPVGVDVADPDLISTLFDPAIVYAKGARLLKMLREYIGEDIFLKGLKAYFQKHAYGNATRDDLWAALSEASGKDIGAFMTPWLTQPGMPVVHADQSGHTLAVSQERFLLDGQPDGSLWSIPLLARSKTQPEVLDTASGQLTLPGKDFAIINQFASGQFITHYVQPKHRDFIIQALTSQTVSTEARINIFNDMYMLARHGDASLTEALDMTLGNQHEPRDSVWSIMLRTVGAAAQLTEGNKTTEAQLKQLRAMLAGKQYQKLGWDDAAKDDPNTKQLRHTMVALMLGGEDTSAIREALRRYEKSKDDLQNMQAELRNTILAAAVKHGGKEVVAHLLQQYPTASPEVQLDITGALAATKSPTIARSVLAKALGPKGFVRQQDVMRWLALFLRNHHVRQTAWDLLVAEWDWIEETLKSGKAFDYLPVYAAGVVASKEWAQKYRDLFEPKLSDKLLERNIRIGLADIDARVAWRKRDEKAIVAWLAKATKVPAKSP